MNSSYANNSSNYYNSYASDDDSSPSDYDSHCDGIWKMSMAAFCLMFTLRILVVTYGQYEILPENCSSVSVTLVEAGYLIPQLDNGDMMALNSTVTVPCMHPLVNTVMNLNCTTAGEVYMDNLDCPPSARCLDLENSALKTYPDFDALKVDWPSVKADVGFKADFQCAGGVLASATCTQVGNDATGDYAQWEFEGMQACIDAQEASVPEDEDDSSIISVVQKDDNGYPIDEGMITQAMHGLREGLTHLNILEKKAHPHLVRHGNKINQINKDLGSRVRDWPNWVITIMAIAVVFLVVGLLYFVFKSCCCKKKSPAQY
eukprot:50032_1